MDFSKLKVSNGSGEAVRALVTGIRTPGSTVINVNTLVNWPTADGFVATSGPLLSNGTIDPAKALVFRGHISGSTIVIDELAPGYTDTYGSSVGDVVVIKPTTWWADTVAEAAESMGEFVEEQGDWRNTATTVSSVTYNGNRSYDITLGADKSALLSPGMRLRSTRTVAAPVQSTSLNGTSQYWTKASPASMTFTTNCSVGVWVKMSEYGTNSTIVSRFNGTNGWNLIILSDGSISLRGYNGSTTNTRGVISRQSLPLNKWVHIAAQVDMTTTTVSATTNYIMLDGVEIASDHVSSGTSPTSFIQAGDLQVGARNGTDFFPGKIAQVAIFSAKVTQATFRGYMSQGLTGLETALVSAYSLSGSSNDLAAAANNLTAAGTATTTNADSPFGGQANGTISSTLDYGIIQRVNGATVTTQVAEGCTIPTTGGVTKLEFSTMKTPYGFPGKTDKWNLYYYQLLARVQAASNSTWYGLQVLTIPTGAWNLTGNFADKINTSTSAQYLQSRVTLSASTSALTWFSEGQQPIIPVVHQQPTSLEMYAYSSVVATMATNTATSLYGIHWLANGSGTLSITSVYTLIVAENAYL